MLVSLTVGKVDAGVAVLLTEDKRLVRETYKSWCSLPERTKIGFKAVYLVLERDFDCDLANRSTDRISFNPSPSFHNLRLNSRHHSRTKSPSRAERAGVIRRSPRAHPQKIRSCSPCSTKSPLTWRNPDLPSSRMGPYTTRDVKSEIAIAL